MTNQRRDERVQLSYYLKAHERGSQKLLGQVLDITVNGINLLGSEKLEPGTSRTILLDLPEPMQRKRRLPLKLECRWSRRDVNPSYYTSGFIFSDIPQTSVDVIATLMERYQFGIELRDAM